ncbi:MAG TPA: alcohol acetyltransferase [Microlunatus sp.]|nr:alcohol acetyltransferase [Microlunatus sp.]
MTRRAWVRLDNASNIFLAARTDADSKVFRISAELDHEIDPQLLQEALDTTYDRYRLYHAVLRSGVFWYYLQDSDLRPVVTAEVEPTCSAIYQPGRRTLLFRVVHHRHRVALEVFHALADGTGALWFLSDLIAAYTRLREAVDDPSFAENSGTTDRQSGSGQADVETAPDERAEPQHELPPDSFAHYFHRRRRRAAPASESAFSRAAAPAALTVSGGTLSARGGTDEAGRLRRRVASKVYRVSGTRSPDRRTRAVELTMPTTDVLALARAEGVALTMYLTAVFFESIRRSSGGLGRAGTLAASVPVNLRQFFPSTSPRNFFATIRVQHTFGVGDDDLGTLCRELDSQFQPKASPDALEKKIRKFIRLERMPVLRIMPRPGKDVILRLVNWHTNRGLSIAVSNLGRIELPEPAQTHVKRMLFHVSAARPQLCAVSHAGLLTISFTSPFTETDHVKEFARHLTASGVDVRVGAARVTEAELAEER